MLLQYSAPLHKKVELIKIPQPHKKQQIGNTTRQGKPPV